MRQAPSSETMQGPTGVRGVQAGQTARTVGITAAQHHIGAGAAGRHFTDPLAALAVAHGKADGGVEAAESVGKSSPEAGMTPMPRHAESATRTPCHLPPRRRVAARPHQPGIAIVEERPPLVMLPQHRTVAASNVSGVKPAIAED